MDRLLSQCGTTLTVDRAMDSNSMERERGITILSKYTSFMYKCVAAATATASAVTAVCSLLDCDCSTAGRRLPSSSSLQHGS